MEVYSMLKEKFGFELFRPGQEAVIRDVLAGKDTIAIMPTGMGKSLCYQLPAYLLRGSILIVSPLIALMEDQVASMKRNGEKSVVALNSFLSYSEKNRLIGELGHYKFIFISPEMLAQSHVLHQLRTINLALIVIDEAHCISQWGFDFRPDYLRIGEFFKELRRPSFTDNRWIVRIFPTRCTKWTVNLRKRIGLKNDFVPRRVQESFMSLHANGRMNWHPYCRKVRLPPPPTMLGRGRKTAHLSRNNSSLGNLIGFVRRMLSEWVYIRMTSVK